MAEAISDSDLLFPCNSIFLAGKLAAIATANSPSVQTSSPRPASSIQRAT